MSSREMFFAKPDRRLILLLIPLLCVFVFLFLTVNTDLNSFIRIQPTIDFWRKNLTLDRIAREYVSKDKCCTRVKIEDVELLPAYRSPCWKNYRREISCLPAFYIGGFPKCSTTDLWRKLTLHPEILTPKPVSEGLPAKEYAWWSANQHATSFRTYINKFTEAGKNPTKIIGDGTPTTICSNIRISQFRFGDNEPSAEFQTAIENYEVTAPHLIVQYSPAAKFIVLFREPAARLYSHYLHEYSMHGRPLPSAEKFHSLVMYYVDKYQSCMNETQSRRYCAYDSQRHGHSNWIYTSMGMYAPYVRDMLKLVPRKNILFVLHNEYNEDKPRVLSRIFNFLGVRSDMEYLESLGIGSSQPYTERVSNSEITPMWEETRQILMNLYRPYNEDLAELMNDRRYLFED